MSNEKSSKDLLAMPTRTTIESSNTLPQEWAEAFNLLVTPAEGKAANPTQLSCLLRRGSDVPVQAQRLLAELIDPQTPLFNVRLVAAEKRNNSWNKYISKLRRRTLVYFEVMRQVQGGFSVAEAKEFVAKSLGLGDETVSKDWLAGKHRWSGILDHQWTKSQKRKKTK